MNRPREIIDRCGYFCASVHGYSMYPLLTNHRDSVYIEKSDTLKKYDVVLFERAGGKLVLHRIIGFDGDKFIICGDNNFKKELVNKEQIIGKMTEFSRNGKEYTVKNLGYRIYSRVWCFSFFTKRILKRIYSCVVKV